MECTFYNRVPDCGGTAECQRVSAGNSEYGDSGSVPEPDKGMVQGENGSGTRKSERILRSCSGR